MKKVFGRKTSAEGVFFFYFFRKVLSMGTGGTEMIRVNGAEMDLAGKTVSEYLEDAGYDRKRIAVERNGRIVTKTQYGETVLEDGDSLEVVSFVGGG